MNGFTQRFLTSQQCDILANLASDVQYSGDLSTLDGAYAFIKDYLTTNPQKVSAMDDPMSIKKETKNLESLLDIAKCLKESEAALTQEVKIAKEDYSSVYQKLATLFK